MQFTARCEWQISGVDFRDASGGSWPDVAVIDRQSAHRDLGCVKTPASVSRAREMERVRAVLMHLGSSIGH
jgi:hypothetical protein